MAVDFLKRETMNKSSPRYTTPEIDYIKDQAKKGRGAKQIRDGMALLAQADSNFHVRSVASVQVKASDLKVSLAKHPLGSYQIPDSGMIGTSIRAKPEQAEWQPWFDAIYAKAGGDTGTLKGALKFALRTTAKAIAEGWV